MALTPGPVVGAPSLAGGMGMDTGLPDAVTQAPRSPQVQEANPYQAPTPPTPLSDNRSFTQKLLGGLLAGAAGGAAASPSQDNGGILGLHNALQNDQQYQQKLQEQNALQQRQFEDQQQQLEQQRANSRQLTQDKLDAARLTEANLHNYQTAMDVQNLPAKQLLDYANRQKDLLSAIQTAGGTTQAIDATHQNLAQLHDQNPGLSSSAYILHIPRPDGHDQAYLVDPNGQDIPAETQAKLLKSVGRELPAGFKYSTKDFLAAYSSAAKDQADNLTKEHIAQTRAAASKKAAAGAASGGGLPPGTTQSQSDQDVLDSIQNGDIRFGSLQGRGEKGQRPRITALAAKQGIDLATLEREDKFASQNEAAPAAAGTLLGVNGQKGQLDLIPDLLKQANVSGIKQLNEIYNKGAVDLNDPRGKAIQEAHNLIVGAIDQYARILTGNNGSTDAARAQAATLFNQHFGDQATAGSVEGIKRELLAREKALSQNSRYLKRDFEKVLAPPADVIAKVPVGQVIAAPNNTQWRVYQDKRGNKRAERAD